MQMYYNAILILCCGALLTQIVLVKENARLDPEIKRQFYSTYIMIAAAALAEWASVLLNGAPEWTIWIHSFVKCLDYVLTPIVGLLFIRQVSQKGTWTKIAYGVLLANTLIQVLSLFTGWTYYIDSENIYHHGPFYTLYIVMYFLILVIATLQLYRYSKQFINRNKTSLYLSVLLVLSGIALQELGGSEVKVVYIALTIGSILLFIHSNEYYQQRADEKISKQETLLEIDSLTGLKSRYAYSLALDKLSRYSRLPEDMVVFMIDINGLKMVNDTMGHAAGDELIIGAAECISATFSAYGDCFRTGGDEFVAVIHAEDNDFPESLGMDLIRKMTDWNRIQKYRNTGLAYGYAWAKDFPEYSIEKLISIADKCMYEQKADYYREKGRDRRRR